MSNSSSDAQPNTQWSNQGGEKMNCVVPNEKLFTPSQHGRLKAMSKGGFWLLYLIILDYNCALLVLYRVFLSDQVGMRIIDSPKFIH
jgi:hypothetical protein